MDFNLCICAAKGSIVKIGRYWGLPEWLDCIENHLPSPVANAITYTRPACVLPYEQGKLLKASRKPEFVY
jgi:hypothetical protein